jgi:AmiR/NasT family two-component response regulator
MSNKLRVAVADDEPDMQEFFRDILTRMGHEVVGVASDGRQLVELCRAQRPQLVITDIRMPGMDGLEAANEIYADAPVPIVIVSAHPDPKFVERAGQLHVLAYLVKPIRESNLAPAIAIAMQRFQELETLRGEAGDLRQALADRKVIERAKGILMKELRLDEDAAFRRLQKLASKKNRKLIEVARTLVEATEALSSTDED